MSWGVSVASTPADRINEAIDAVELDAHSRTPEHEEQLAAAKEAAKVLIAKKGLGTPAEFRSYLSGHANEGHAHVIGYSDSTITVSVTAVPAKPE